MNTSSEAALNDDEQKLLEAALIEFTTQIELEKTP